MLNMVKLHTIELNDEIYNKAYRVVTMDMKSLGLDGNPNILTYPIGEWFYLSEKDVEEGKGSWGGIWVGRTLGKARSVAKYMKKKHNIETRIFDAAIDKILFANDYRVKTNGIYLMDEHIFMDLQ